MSPREAVEKASLTTSQLIARAIRDTAEETRGESEIAADGMIALAEAIEEKAEGFARDLGANYARASVLSLCDSEDAP